MNKEKYSTNKLEEIAYSVLEDIGKVRNIDVEDIKPQVEIRNWEELAREASEKSDWGKIRNWHLTKGAVLLDYVFPARYNHADNKIFLTERGFPRDENGIKYFMAHELQHQIDYQKNNILEKKENYSKKEWKIIKEFIEVNANKTVRETGYHRKSKAFFAYLERLLPLAKYTLPFRGGTIRFLERLNKDGYDLSTIIDNPPTKTEIYFTRVDSYLKRVGKSKSED